MNKIISILTRGHVWRLEDACGVRTRVRVRLSGGPTAVKSAIKTKSVNKFD